MNPVEGKKEKKIYLWDPLGVKKNPDYLTEKRNAPRRTNKAASKKGGPS